MTIQTNLFINNEYVPSSSGETLKVYNPADGSLVSDQIQSASPGDVDKAVSAAKVAFKIWRSTPTAVRAAAMLKYADLVEQNADKVGELEHLCMGAPRFVAKAIVQSQAAAFRYYAGLVDKIPGETYPEDGDGLFKFVNYEPLGVCAGIAAWNGTQLFAGWKIAPAVATGNTCVFKSSEKSPLGTLFLGQLFREAGFPPGVVNLLSGDGKVGALLSSHMDIAKISFTGSTNTGRQIQIAAAKSNLKIVKLELGGKSPAIVFNDAVLETAVEGNSQGFLLNSAQACSAGSRILVQEDIAPQFLEKLKAAYLQYTQAMADPTLESTSFLGPLADKAQFDRVMSFLDIAKKEHIETLVGGGKKESKGYYVEPTILLNPDTKSQVYTDEIFGPVVTVRTFKTEEEAIELANDTSYGLSATLYTSDITRALRVSAQLEAGTVSINAAHRPTMTTPFGGKKQSGYGRESGIAGLREYLDPKTIHINLHVPSSA